MIPTKTRAAWPAKPSGQPGQTGAANSPPDHRAADQRSPSRGAWPAKPSGQPGQTAAFLRSLFRFPVRQQEDRSHPKPGPAVQPLTRLSSSWASVPCFRSSAPSPCRPPQTPLGLPRPRVAGGCRAACGAPPLLLGGPQKGRGLCRSGAACAFRGSFAPPAQFLPPRRCSARRPPPCAGGFSVLVCPAAVPPGSGRSALSLRPVAALRPGPRASRVVPARWAGLPPPSGPSAPAPRARPPLFFRQPFVDDVVVPPLKLVVAVAASRGPGAGSLGRGFADASLPRSPWPLLGPSLSVGPLRGFLARCLAPLREARLSRQLRPFAFRRASRAVLSWRPRAAALASRGPACAVSAFVRLFLCFSSFLRQRAAPSLGRLRSAALAPRLRDAPRRGRPSAALRSGGF